MGATPTTRSRRSSRPWVGPCPMRYPSTLVEEEPSRRPRACCEGRGVRSRDGQHQKRGPGTRSCGGRGPRNGCRRGGGRLRRPLPAGSGSVRPLHASAGGFRSGRARADLDLHTTALSGDLSRHASPVPRQRGEPREGRRRGPRLVDQVGATLSFTVFAAVDISEGRCVRLLRGRFGSETVYSDDPVEVALGWCRAGAPWLHVVDLDGARTGTPANRHLVLETASAASCPVQAGGGFRDIDDVESALAAGARRGVLGTVALDDPAALGFVCARHGDRIAVSLDARGGELATHGWTVGTGVGVLDAVAQFEAAGASAFIYTDVSRDGTMAGPDLAGLQRLARETDLPVIASGGISSLDDLRAVARLHDQGVAGAIVGRALYDGAFTIAEAAAAADAAVRA